MTYSEDDVSRAVGAMAVSIAIAAERMRKVNPMNGDGSNNLLDRLLAEIDNIAGSQAPSTCAAAERARLRADYEAGWRALANDEPRESDQHEPWCTPDNPCAGGLCDGTVDRFIMGGEPPHGIPLASRKNDDA